MGTLIDGAGGRGFGATGKGEMGDSFVADKGGGQMKTVLSGVEGAEYDTD